MKRLLSLSFILIASFTLAGCLPKSDADKRADATIQELQSMGDSRQNTSEQTAPTTQTQKGAPMDFSQYANAQELVIEDQKVGTGAEAKEGSNVTVHYSGWLTNGTQFDTSHKGANQPITFPLVSGGLIEGWIQGVPGMKVGGTRRLIIPASLGYGAGGIPGVIPGNAVLVFDIELVNVQ